MDWSDAYENRAYVADFDAIPPRLAAEAATFRAARGSHAELGIAYGEGDRQVVDLFRPEGAAKGLIVFVHGGYWRTFHAREFSHLAAGPLAHGWAVAMPAYTLVPAARVAEIVVEVGAAIARAAMEIGGPIRLCGHSVGGHLVTRAMSRPSPLPADVVDRVERIVAVSGLFDLRPLVWTDKNEDIRLDAAEAEAESPALLRPARPATPLTAWVGADERPEFLRQSRLIANVWTGCGVETAVHVAEGQDHFTVIDPLAEPESPLTRALAG